MSLDATLGLALTVQETKYVHLRHETRLAVALEGSSAYSRYTDEEIRSRSHLQGMGMLSDLISILRSALIWYRGHLLALTPQALADTRARCSGQSVLAPGLLELAADNSKAMARRGDRLKGGECGSGPRWAKVMGPYPGRVL